MKPVDGFPNENEKRVIRDVSMVAFVSLLALSSCLHACSLCIATPTAIYSSKSSITGILRLT
jgi:hypothetical protein